MRYVLHTLLILTVSLSGCADRAGKSDDITSNGSEVITEPIKKRISSGSDGRQPAAPKDQAVVELRRETGSKSKKKTPLKTASSKPEKTLEIRTGNMKKVFEFVDIGGEKYPVPRPWRGKRITEKSPPFSELQQIPVEYTWNRSELFIHRDAREAFVEMARAAAEDGVDLRVHSGFRSVWYQKNIFTKLMSDGRTWEDLVRYVAPPGYSEHMLGMAVDLYPSNWEFASTDAYRWLQEHGADFGFSETYPEYGTDGFPWEAWHWRYTADEAVEPAGHSSKEAVAKYGGTEQQQ